MRVRPSLTTVLFAVLVAPLLVAQAALPARADQTVTLRIADGQPVASAVHVAGVRYPSPTSQVPAHVVLSRDDLFADSLAGTPLLADGPLLFTATSSLPRETRDELARLRGGVAKTLYLLGGPDAISVSVESAVRDLGYDVVRLDGETRVETSVAIAENVIATHGGTEVLLARSHGSATNPGSGWVDSVAGGAHAANRRLPVLLTHTEAMDPPVAAWLQQRNIRTTRLLGGPIALSAAVEAAAPGATRHWGDDRTDTAAAIARELWGVGDTGKRSFTIVDGSDDRGWAFGLAAAGLAADNDDPVLLTMDRVTAATRRLVATCGNPQVDLTIIGDGTLVSGAVREYLDDLDGEGCGPDRTLTRSPRLEGFASCPDLLSWYRTNALERVTAYGLDSWYPYGGIQTEVLGEPMQDAAGAPQPAAAPAAPATGEDVSGTNTQEAGVDEPDIVKTDGDLAAVVRGDGSVDLIDLTGSAPEVAATLPATNQYGRTELLLTDDVLTTLTTTGGGGYFPAEDAFAPGLPGPVTTTVTRWDVSSVSSPSRIAAFEMDGGYRSARMIDGVARIVVESGPQGMAFTYPEDGSDEEATRALEHNRAVVASSSLDNWLPSWGAAGSRGDGSLVVDCRAVHEPPAWSGFSAVTVVTFDTASDTEPGAAATVVAQSENVYASLDRLLVTTGRWGEAFEGEQLDSNVSTEVHAFDITVADDIAYTGSGRVNGYVINQFALSESNGDIRVAATTQPPWTNDGQQRESESFVAVLRESGGELDEVGRVGGLGRGEQIQAVRFLGNLGIVVTFRQIDPLYLIDLSDGTRPRVTGELKDTGFSEYLHRVGDDLLLGVGVDANEDGQRLGAQVVLYDIGDRSNPTRVDRVTVANAFSPVGDDHRAFLYWRPTGDAFVPFSVYDNEHREYASVIRVEGRSLVERGRLTHSGSTASGQPSQILRTFIVGDDVYSVSQEGIARHNLSNLSTTAYTNLAR